MKKRKLLVADDDVFFQRLIESLLSPDYDLVIVQDGMEAWHELQRPQAPRLALLDWVMPGLSGPQICRRVRVDDSLSSLYVILLTARNNESDIIAGLQAGADDYISKPPLPAELRARIRMGERVLALQDAVQAQSRIGNPRMGVESLRAERSSIRSLASPHRNRLSTTSDEQPPSSATEERFTPTVETEALPPQRETLQEGRHSKH